LVLLALITSLALLGGGTERFENRAFGHTVAVPPGWVAQVGAEDRATTVATYRVARTDRWERPPRGHVRLTIADYGRRPCSRESTRPGEPIRLIGPASFEGFHGYTAVFCRRGHLLQAFVLPGLAVGPARIEQARRVIASLRLTPRAHAAGNVHTLHVLGRSVEGRPLRAWRIGNPRCPRRVLVVGCVHGDACGGMRVTQQLVNLARPIAVDLWVVQNLNPDGLRRRSRGNARGVDLDRDFGRFTQPETRVLRDLVLRRRPELTVWLVRPGATPASVRWQRRLGLRALAVELPLEPTHAVALRHARAILRAVGE
jgi:hypothetical protein